MFVSNCVPPLVKRYYSVFPLEIEQKRAYTLFRFNSCVSSFCPSYMIVFLVLVSLFEWTTLKQTVKAIQKDIKVLYILFLALGMRLLAHEMNGGCLMCLKKRPLIIIRDYGYLLMKATKTIISKVYNVSCNFKLLWRLSSTDTSHTVCILMETSFYSEKQWKKEKIWKWLKK